MEEDKTLNTMNCGSKMPIYRFKSSHMSGGVLSAAQVTGTFPLSSETRSSFQTFVLCVCGHFFRRCFMVVLQLLQNGTKVPKSVWLETTATSVIHFHCLSKKSVDRGVPLRYTDPLFHTLILMQKDEYNTPISGLLLVFLVHVILQRAH